MGIIDKINQFYSYDNGLMKEAKRANWVLLKLLVALGLLSSVTGLVSGFFSLNTLPLLFGISLSTTTFFGIMALAGLKRLSTPFSSVFSLKNSPPVLLTTIILIFLYYSLTLCEITYTAYLRYLFNGTSASHTLPSPLFRLIPFIKQKPLLAALFLFHIIVWGPLCEELLFRGYFQRAYTLLGSFCGVFFPSILFAFLHGPGMAPFSKIFMSAALSLITLRHDNTILPAFYIHMLNNILPVMLLGLLYGFMPSPQWDAWFDQTNVSSVYSTHTLWIQTVTSPSLFIYFSIILTLAFFSFNIYGASAPCPWSNLTSTEL